MANVDWPFGTPDERQAATDRLPGHWKVINRFRNYYKIYGTNSYHYHTGIDPDLPVPKPNADYRTPVWSPADGVVVYSARAGGTWGQVIVIRHQGFYSRLAHVENRLVAVGDHVVMGQQVAIIGSGDGQYAGGAEHVHFDIAIGDILGRHPLHWPGQNLKKLLAWYVDPVQFVILNKRGLPA